MSSNKLDKKQDVYDVEIDRYIVNFLKDNSSIGHGELKRGSEQELKRKISPVTFSKHLSRLVSKGLLKKEEHGIGKKTDYLLTEMALKKISLGLLGNSQEKIDLFKRIYSTIFFFDVYRLPKVTTSEYEFEKLLARFKLNKNDLNWNRIIFAENSEAADQLMA